MLDDNLFGLHMYLNFHQDPGLSLWEFHYIITNYINYIYSHFLNQYNL